MTDLRTVDGAVPDGVDVRMRPTSMWSGSRRIFAGLVLSAGGALGLVAAFEPVGAWPLVFVSFVPILYAEHVVLPRAWAGLAAVVGFGGYIGYLTWDALAASQRPWLVLAAVALWFSGNVERRWQEATGYRHFWWSGAVVWTGWLFAVGRTPLASWVDPAYALYLQSWLIQPVSIFAISGANLLIMLTNHVLATMLLVGPRRRRVAAGVGVAVMVTCWTVLSVALLGEGRTGQSVRVAAVQPGAIARVDRLAPEQRAVANALILAELEAGTRRAARSGAQLVVWPEKALQYVDPSVDEATQLQRLVAETHVHLVIGYTPDPRRLNRARLLDPGGTFLGVYDKQHPVQFAGDHSVGGPVVVSDTALGRVAPMICYDLDYEDTGRAAARQGANLLAVPSEDWPGIARQHYTHLVFRAVENRVAAVKADTAWDSAIIDPDGRIVAAHVTTKAGSAVLVATVPLGTGHSAFTATGNWVGWTCILLTAGWALIALRARRGRRPSGSPMR